MNKKLILAIICAMALIAVVQSAEPVPAPTAAESKLCGTHDTNIGRGYAWVNDHCELCASGCAKCTTGGGCDACIDTWVFVDETKKENGCWQPMNGGTGTALSAATADTNCQKPCADVKGKTLSCVECKPTFGLKGNTCAGCPASCNKCKFADANAATVGTCDECIANYYLADGKCTQCPSTIENCDQCDSTGKSCARCKDGFQLQSGKCTTCASPAVECDDKGNATKCAANAWLDKTTDSTKPVCKTCPTGCAACTDDKTCTACATWQGFVLAAGVCEACTVTNALYCVAGDKTKALVCKPGYAVISTGACVDTISNCLKHTADKVCGECAKDYVYHQNKCVKLGTNDLIHCASATAATAVDTNAVCTCKAALTTPVSNVWAYYKKADNLCAACPAHCKACALEGTTLKCSTCASALTTPTSSGVWNYYLKADFLCYECPANCKVCGTDGKCTTCDTDYIKSTTETQCQRCKGLESSGQCKAVADISSGTAYAECVKSSDGSSACVQADCSTGYKYVSGSKACEPCDTANGVKTCDASAHLSCNDGYWLNSGACTKCPTGCNKCTAATDKCTECTDGYHMTFVSGSTTEGNCAVCTTNYKTASSCSTLNCYLSTHAIVGADCVAYDTSVSNVTRDPATSQITKCPNDEYWLEKGSTTIQGKCHKCSSTATNAPALANCKECSADKKCTRCDATYTLQGATPSCLADANCGYINESKSECVWCKAGNAPDTNKACKACTGACTFNCNLPSLAPPAGPGGAGAGGATESSNGALLTFAFAALLALLALLF